MAVCALVRSLTFIPGNICLKYPLVINSLQMWMSVRSMEPVQNTPPVQIPLALSYALAMKDS